MKATKPTKAMLWKEWRECWPWAIVGGLLLLVGLARAIATILRDDVAYSGSVLSEEGFQWMTTVGFAALAFVLGLRQTLPEMRSEPWAFLVHRPLSSSQLWLAKVIVGLALYLGAALAVLASVVAWVAVPGHVPAPFYWRMALPGLADLAGGIPYYFAGMIVGLRPARWYASRILPIGAGVLASAILWRSTFFGTAIVWCLVASAITAAAAWRSFARDAGGARAALGSVAVGSVLLTGLLGVWLVGMILLVAPMLEPPRNSPSIMTPANFAPIETVGVTEDGRVLIQGQHGGRRYWRDAAKDPTVNYLDAGQEVEARFVSMEQFSPCERPRGPGSYRTSRDMVQLFRTLGKDRRQVYHYSFVENVILGYDTATCERISCIGPQGSGSACDPFPEPPISIESSLLICPNAIYRIDFESERTVVLDTALPGESLVSLHRGEGSYRPHEWTYVIATRSVHVLQREEKGYHRIATLPFPEDMVGSPAGLIGYLEDRQRFVLLAFPWSDPSYPWSDASETGTPVLFELSADGALLARHELPYLERPRAILAEASVAEQALSAGMVPLAVLLDDAERLPQRTFVLALLFAATYAAIAWWIAGRSGLRRIRLAWVALAIPLGAIAVLAQLAMQARPPRPVCPQCGRRRLATRESCERCGGGWQVSARDGTEILVAV